MSSENARLLQLYRTRVLLNDPAPLTADLLTLPSNGDRRGSPFRNANFDLVKNYTLYLGLRTAVRELAARRKSEDAEWLENFVSENGGELIRPHGSTFGAADAVVEKILAASPAIRDGRAGFFDPRRLAEMVLGRRASCAEEWLQVMRDANDDQLDLERHLLEGGL